MNKLRTITIVIAVAALAAISASARYDVGLAWKHSPSVGVQWYKIYWANGNVTNPAAGAASSTLKWTNVVTVPGTSNTAAHKNVPAGTNFWYATSADDTDESGPSEIVSMVITPFQANPLPPLELTASRTNHISININIRNANE